jgi:hypothetical protein
MSKITSNGSISPRRGRGAVFGEGSMGRALVGGFRGWSMNLPSEQRGERPLQRCLSLPVLQPLGH